jgi:hypothetical protein
LELTREQTDLLRQPWENSLFLQGPAGSGKTTVAALRLLNLLDAGIPGDSILVLVPQRTLAQPYREAVLSAGAAQPQILTAGGLARRLCDLFWPLVAAEAGFAHPDRPPAFLTLETAQYYMAHLVRPLLDEQHLFDSLAIDRNRLYSQILDNLNKAALAGFDYTQLETRLRSAWNGEASQLNVYADAQHCAGLFRRYCLENNLLDFSLQVELFRAHLWPSHLVRAYLKDSYRHLIADNLEEDTPFAHDLVAGWLPDLDTALLVCDQDAGYRSYLSADRLGAFELAGACDRQITFPASLVPPAGLEAFGARIGEVLERPGVTPADAGGLPEELIVSRRHRFYPQMLDAVAAEVSGLLAGGVPPGQIAVLAPLLPDSLRYALAGRFDRLSIPYRSHRPSRALGDEPAARCLLTLAQLAHPTWELKPSRFDVAYALIQSITGLDLVRAQLIAEIALRTREGRQILEPLDRLVPEMQERITYTLGERYETLRAWIHAYTQETPIELDFFLSRLFGEVLSQPGFGFHTDLNAGQTAANLIESAAKFRRAVNETGAAGLDPLHLGREYCRMVADGVIAAQYVESWQSPADDAVFIAPAYTFLLNNQPVAHQIWLDIGSNAWFERLYQPLTHPYVLSHRWPEGKQWTSVEEFDSNRETLYRLVTGLIRRCASRIHLALCELNEGGTEQRGMLLKAVYQIQLLYGGGRASD